MADLITLEVVTPQSAAYTGTVSGVTLPGAMGQLGILPGHLPLVTALRGGEMVAAEVGGSRRFAIGSGFAEVLPDRVTVIVKHCDGADEVDAEHAREALAVVEKRLATGDFVDDAEMEAHADEAARHRARLALVERA
ncbi:MAG: F-type H+-transporting ATPase subunit epsilon, partial [Bradymonadia bacterium]